jgi:hypothetical protein
LERDAKLAEQGIEDRERLLRSVPDRSFYNTHQLTFARLLEDEDNVPANLVNRLLPAVGASVRLAAPYPLALPVHLTRRAPQGLDAGALIDGDH